MLEIQWAAPLNFPLMWQWFFTFPSPMSFFHISNTCYLIEIVLLLRSWSNLCWNVFHYFFTVLVLFKKCFNNFISSIFISVKNNWFTKFIININKFISKTTRKVILIFFLSKNLYNFQLWLWFLILIDKVHLLSQLIQLCNSLHTL